MASITRASGRPGWRVNGYQVRVFDVGPAIEERYTVVLMSYYPPEKVENTRQRVMWAIKTDGSCRELLAIAGEHLGDDFPFPNLPEAGQEAVIRELEKYAEFRKKRVRA